ncbi:MAG: SDR family NAD(P)-dependent oxidoreductase [Methyloceanibacter sp.]|nr:SDR family NAD(P)-dependent oxidoreductase [Methyloceanibacter sp.]
MTSSIVLITGASSGIGEATSKLYASRGASIVLLARSQDRLERVAGEIKQAGGAASPYPIDLADSDAVGELGQRISRELGTPDILINNAGAGRWLPFLETSPEEARAMIAVPYLAAFYITRAFLPSMLARGSGNIACITSPASYLVWPNASAYTAARHALAGFTEALRTEMRGKGIAVTLVVLGMVESPYWEHNPGSRDNVPKATKLLPVLSPERAAKAIYAGVARGSRTVVKPALLRPLFLLNALMPRLVAAQMRRAPKRNA